MASKQPCKPVLCKKCGNCLRSRVILTDNDYYHVECFRCNDCGWDLTAACAFYERDGSIYCQKCRDKDSDLTCYGCTEPFSDGTCLRVLNRCYHDKCAKCDKCQKPFPEMKYYPIANDACCLDCYWMTVAKLRSQNQIEPRSAAK